MAVLHQPNPWLDLECIGGGQQIPFCSWLQIEWRLPYGAVCLGTIPDRSGVSLPSIAIRKGPNLSRMRPPSDLNGDLESVPLCRLAASIHLGRHCCVAVAVFRTGGPVNQHPRRGGRILR
ncbi:hypothetical protein PVAP13_5KG778901 [Panicum virgatum]|uniref:Uncharacterized protein n=1 Tax=Panicum virgatum TaxID=38727 RepID=A0A8T0T2T7_PANVG|nr:hypothetical protein PVAP13_5KG778901 [Panicum virgatum]